MLRTDAAAAPPSSSRANAASRISSSVSPRRGRGDCAQSEFARILLDLRSHTVQDLYVVHYLDTVQNMDTVHKPRSTVRTQIDELDNSSKIVTSQARPDASGPGACGAFASGKPKTSSKSGYDEPLAARLWQVSADLVTLTAAVRTSRSTPVIATVNTELVVRDPGRPLPRRGVT